MLEKITDLPTGLDGLRAAKQVSKDDYERVFEPLVDEARRAGRRIRLLYHFGPEFEGFTPGGAWEDATLGLGAMRLFEGCAIVSDVEWIRASARLVGVLMPCPIRVFDDGQRHEAIDWLEALPEGIGVSHRLVPESEVLVVEVEKPLRAQDFDALSIAADTWLETHRDLRGLVIHAREFPGWEDVGSFLRHVRFVRDHHRTIGRVALAVDSRLAAIAPRLGDHFVEAEIESFGYDELDGAIAWAGAPAPNASSTAPHSSASS